MSETQNRKNNCRGEREKGVPVPLVGKCLSVFTNLNKADLLSLLFLFLDGHWEYIVIFFTYNNFLSAGCLLGSL